MDLVSCNEYTITFQVTHTNAVHVGYASNAAVGLHKQLLQSHGEGWCIHSRVLGNVLYLMTNQKTTKETVMELEARVSRSLEKMGS